MRLLFEGGYYSGCGYYSNKYGKLFLHEDLSPDERSNKCSGSDGTVTNTHPPTVSSQATSCDTTHISAIPGAYSVPAIPVHS